MKTKTLVLAALIGVASAATSMAQSVYSANAVGYVTIPIPNGFSLIANPLNGADNSIPALIPNPPNNTRAYKFNNSANSYENVVYSTLTGVWSTIGGTNMLLRPGEGIFLRNPGAAFNLTFVGSVPQGTLVNVLPSGFIIASSQVPVSGLLASDLMFPIANGDKIYLYDNIVGYKPYQYNLDTWFPPAGTPAGNEQPIISVGQSFFVKKTVSVPWSRTFSVNN